MFKSFKKSFAKVNNVNITYVIGGSGPPLLLLHGYPQTHVIWHKIAPTLATKYTVVASDLRGYGDSSKPPTDERHEPYSKRAMAEDQVQLMKNLGFDRFLLIGHDRGGRVGHRDSMPLLARKASLNGHHARDQRTVTLTPEDSEQSTEALNVKP